MIGIPYRHSVLIAVQWILYKKYPSSELDPESGNC